VTAPGTVVTASEEETAAVGEQIGKQLAPGAVLLLFGDLGAGKTALVRGLARGLGADPDDVSSPTFTIVQEYAGSRARLQHVDLYRLEPAEIEDLGLDDLMDGSAVVAIEWADRWPGRPRAAIELRLEHAGEGRRRIVASGVRISGTD
jgi:tRNA threonylcarbamoyladenosine biosynthesis protein TsaE